MATKYECDRCHAESMSSDSISILTIPQSRRLESYTKDLCQSCIVELNNFLEPLPMAIPRPYYEPVTSTPTLGPVTRAEGALPMIEPGILLEEINDDDIPL